jgi:hypothetical protein
MSINCRLFAYTDHLVKDLYSAGEKLPVNTSEDITLASPAGTYR